MDYQKKSIKTSVVACIIDEQNRVLLTRRCVEPFCGQWVMPGGKIDHGEAILAALHREVREEVGLEIIIDRLLDVYEHTSVGDAGDHYVILYYKAHPLAKALSLNGAEVTEASWVAAAGLDGYNMTPGTRHVLAQVFPDVLTDPGEPPDELADRSLATGGSSNP